MSDSVGQWSAECSIPLQSASASSSAARLVDVFCHRITQAAKEEKVKRQLPSVIDQCCFAPGSYLSYRASLTVLPTQKQVVVVEGGSYLPFLSINMT